MILRELFESKAKSVGIIFGRFNPPHMGHRAAWEMAAQNPHWYVGTNKSTQGPKDPLPFDIKVKAMQAVYPEIKGHIVAEQSWLTLASKIYEKHGNIVLNVYTDEAWVTKALVQYNGKEGAHGYYEFGTIQQQDTPRLSSATALRNAVAADDRDLFGQAAGVDPNTLVAGHPFFDVVKHYLMPHAEKAAAKQVKKKVKQPEQGVAEGKVKLYTDPDYFGAEVDDAGFDSLPVVNISADRLVGFEPDSKMNQTKSQANVEKIVAGLKKGNKLPPLLVRKYKDGYQVLDGHHRFWAYKLLGTKNIPVRIVADKDIEEISKQGVAEGESNAIDTVAKRLTDPKDGISAKLRAAGDKRREDKLKGRDISRRDTTSKDEWGNLKQENAWDRLQREKALESAGVGIITKQNSTVDVNKSTPKKNLKAFRLI